MSPSESQDARIANLEIAIAHQQKDYDTLNAVVTEYANQVDKLLHTVRQLGDRVAGLEAIVGEFSRGSFTGGQSSSRTPEEDRPPHY